MITFIKAGQTKENAKQLASGRRDVSLSRRGKVQAKECAQIMMHTKFDVVFCSPLKRAKQTAKIVLKHHKGVPIIYDDRLLEREEGSATGLTQEEAFSKFAWDFKKKYKFEGFEQPAEMFKRVSSFYDDILKEYKDKSVVVISHDGVGKMSRMYFEGLPECKNLDGFLFDNARPYVLKKD